MEQLITKRCFNHVGREAVARCPKCRRFFCRECVTEHEGDVICSGCLGDIASAHASKGKLTLRVLGRMAAACGLAVAVLFFYCLGRMLLLLPTDFHEGTLWVD